MSVLLNAMRKEHFKPLDGLRGIAILLVILVHSFNYKGSSLLGRGLETVARAGWVGVTLFFVLSGFLITGILLDTRGQKNYLRDFFARRSLRIFPVYFAFLAVYFFIVPQIPGAAERLSQPYPEMRIYYWTYTTNMSEWISGCSVTVPALDPLWSLAVEEQVYFLWPFLILLVPRRWLGPSLVGIAFASFLWRFLTRLTAQSVALSYSWAPANLESFAAGAIVALSFRDFGHVLRSWAPRCAIASGFFIAGMWAGQRHFNFWDAPVPMLTVGTTGLVFFFAAIIGISVTSSEKLILNKILAASWLRMFGKYSYAIYLFHSSIIELLGPVVYPERMGAIQGEDLSGGLIFTAGVTGCSLIVACLSWYVLESQFLKLKRYFPLSSELMQPECVVVVKDS